MLAGCGSAEGGGGLDLYMSASNDMTGGRYGCDPTAEAGKQGCDAGKRCTWILRQDMPDPEGRFGCVPEGTAGLDSPCVRGAVGDATGYDNCKTGLICIGAGAAATCMDLCGFTANPETDCPAGQVCTPHEGLGVDGVFVGTCAPTCDPLHQTRTVDGKSTDCGPGKGCYVFVSVRSTTAVCATAGKGTHGQPIEGTAYANSCAPGYVPRRAAFDKAGTECSILCKPADVYKGHNEAYENGDTRERNFADMPATCESGGGVSARSDTPGTGETCQFYWTRESANGVTPYSNTLGWCFKVAAWRYDTDGRGPNTDTDPYPRCITLSTGDVLPPHNLDPNFPKNDALYFGCIALTGMSPLLADPPTRIPPTMAGPWRPEVLAHMANPPTLDRLGPFNR